jgi:hypothetical protein
MSPTPQTNMRTVDGPFALRGRVMMVIGRPQMAEVAKR